jgi:hypothetical protein
LHQERKKGWPASALVLEHRDDNYKARVESHATLHLEATFFLSLHLLATSAIGKTIAERLGFVGILHTPNGFKPV